MEKHNRMLQGLADASRCIRGTVPEAGLALGVAQPDLVATAAMSPSIIRQAAHALEQLLSLCRLLFMAILSLACLVIALVHLILSGIKDLCPDALLVRFCAANGYFDADLVSCGAVTCAVVKIRNPRDRTLDVHALYVIPTLLILGHVDGIGFEKAADFLMEKLKFTCDLSR